MKAYRKTIREDLTIMHAHDLDTRHVLAYMILNRDTDETATPLDGVTRTVFAALVTNAVGQIRDEGLDMAAAVAASYGLVS